MGKPSTKYVMIRTIPADAGPAGVAAAKALADAGYDDLGKGRWGATDAVFRAASAARIARHKKRVEATQTGESV